MLRFIKTDGGRAADGFKGSAGDCAVRAVCIALNVPYKATYEELGAIVASTRKRSRQRKKKNARNGIYRNHMQTFMMLKGWTWHEFEIGELPTFEAFALVAPSRCVVLTKGHYFAMIDGVRHDTHMSERTGSVIGYYSKG